MFLPTLDIGGTSFLAGALLTSITLLIVLDRWTSAESVRTNGVGIRARSAVYWLVAVPTMVGIVLFALTLILPLMFAAFTGDAWLRPTVGF